MNLTTISKLDEIGDKIKPVLSAADKIFLAGLILDWLDVGVINDDIPPTPDNTEIEELVGYTYKASDHPDYLGEWYFMPDSSLKGKISSVIVGTINYRYVMDWNDSELWYGKSDHGVITVTLRDGSVLESAEVAIPDFSGLTKETLDWFGRYNGDRGTWYGKLDMKDYPDVFYLSVTGCLERAKVINNGKRFEIGGKSGFIIKQSDVQGRPLAVICPVDCRGKEACIEF